MATTTNDQSDNNKENTKQQQTEIEKPTAKPETEPKQKPEPKITPPPKAKVDTESKKLNKLNKNIQFLKFFIVLVVLAGAGGFFYLNQQITNIPKPQAVVDYKPKIDQLFGEVSKINNGFNSNQQQVKSALSQAESALSKVESALNQISSSIVTSKNQALDKAKPIILDAIWLLEVRQEPQQATKMLTKAAKILHQYQDPQNIQLQAALSKAALDLIKISQLDTKKALTELAQLESLVNNLKLPEYAHKAPKKNISRSISSLSSSIWQDLTSLVRVSQDDEKEMSRLISKEAKTMAYMLLKLQLKYIRMSVITANQEMFQTDIKTTISLTKSMFVVQNSDDFIVKLQQLAKLKIQSDQTPQSFQVVKELVQE